MCDSLKEKGLAEMFSPAIWRGSCLGSECSLHQIAPYIGKMKSSIAKALIQSCSKPGDIILDPFVGSGTVALESVIEGRGVICCDTNPYAVALTRAKLFAPPTVDRALAMCRHYLNLAKKEVENVDLSEVPEWVAQFYHPKTLREIIALATLLKHRKQYFLMGCLLGILHHQRPGFLSYPASHAVPYLRTRRFPKETYPELYEYREVNSRLLKKIVRVYRRVPNIQSSLVRKCFHKDALHLHLKEDSIDAVVTSPPYMNALDYIRDNRLRLWLLGFSKETNFDKDSPNSPQEFKQLISECFLRIGKALRPGKKSVIVIGEVNKNGRNVNTASTILEIAKENGNFDHLITVEDGIPIDRRIRRTGSCTRREWIIVFRRRR